MRLTDAAMDGTHVTPQLCNGERDGAEGSLVVRRIACNDDGFVSCRDATLRVRFATCDALVDGRSLSASTYVVHFPA